MFRFWCAALLGLSFVSLSGAAELEPGPYVVKPLSADFQRLADLVGEWEGTKVDAEGEQAVTVEYYLSSGASALVERLFKDTPMEMTTVYHDHGDRLMATHYCGLGNQPRYVAEGFDGDTIDFRFHDASNLASPEEMHMHGVKLTFESPDVLIQEWSHYHGGQPAGTVTVRLQRVVD